MKTFFFLEITCFRPKKTALNPDFGQKNPYNFSEDLFFFLRSPVFGRKKPLDFPISAGKSLGIFGLHLVHLIQTGINFSCVCALLEYTEINFSCPPKIYFCPPPSHAILATGLTMRCVTVRNVLVLTSSFWHYRGVALYWLLMLDFQPITTVLCLRIQYFGSLRPRTALQ